MKEFFDYFTKENVENIALTLFFMGVLGIIYSIIAGIWGFAPIEFFNLKIFGTSLLIGLIGIVIGYVNDDINENTK